MDIDAYWEYSDPAASETRFQAALAASRGDERLEILTQIARSHSLRKRFADAHRVLDGIEAGALAAGARPRIRLALERGRTFNSAGERDKARVYFLRAWDLAREEGEDGLAVDAAHMVAITLPGTTQALDWSARGLAIARASKDPKAQALVAAMLNNSAWDLHDLGRHAEALERFREAEAAWTARGKAPQVRTARWSTARCLRSMGRHDEALAILRALDRDEPGEERVAGEIARNLEGTR